MIIPTYCNYRLKFLYKIMLCKNCSRNKALPVALKETDDYKAFKKELKLFLLLQSFYSEEDSVEITNIKSVEEFVFT